MQAPHLDQLQRLEIQELSGKRDGTFRYYYVGNLYHADSRNPYILRCSRRSTIYCPGSLIFNDNGEIETIIQHDGQIQDDMLVQKALFKEVIFRKCQTTFDTYTDIFNQTSRE